MEMITVDEAMKCIAGRIPKKFISHQVPLMQSLGYYAAKEVKAPLPVPAFDNSAMDGYGVAFSDLEDHKWLSVLMEITSGESQLSNHQKGTAGGQHPVKRTANPYR